MLRIEDLHSGQFYKNGNGQLIYLLKITFEDTIQKFKSEMDEVQRLPSHDHIVYRKMEKGGMAPCHSKYSWLSMKDRFIECVDKEVLFDENINQSYIEHNEQRFYLRDICSPSYSINSVHAQAVPYKFPYKLVLGKEYSFEKSNFEQRDFHAVIMQLADTIGFESFLNFSLIGPSMYGGDTVVYGTGLWFNSEENYNLARLILPIKFS